MQIRILLKELPYSEANAVGYLELLTSLIDFHLGNGDFGNFKSQSRQILSVLRQLKL